MIFPFIFGVFLIILLYESNERKFVKRQVLDKKKIYQLEQENKALKHQLEASPYEREQPSADPGTRTSRVEEISRAVQVLDTLREEKNIDDQK